MTRAPRARLRSPGSRHPLPGARSERRRLLLLVPLLLILGVILGRIDAWVLLLYGVLLLLLVGMITINVLTHRENLAAAFDAHQAASHALRRQPASLHLQQRYIESSRYYYALLRTFPGNRPTPSLDDERRIQIELHELLESIHGTNPLP